MVREKRIVGWAMGHRAGGDGANRQFVTARPERTSKGTIDGARGEGLILLTRCENEPWSCHWNAIRQ